ncbi:MAG: hypothetical protein ACE5GR_08355 [Nitrosopumilus sp.]
MLTSVLAAAPTYSEPQSKAFAQVSPDNISDIGSYVIFGFDEVELEKEVTIISGNVGVQDKKSEIEIDDKVTFEDPDSALVGDEIEIDKKAVIQNVYYNELKNKGDILGTQNTPLSLPVIESFPDIPNILPGNESVKVKKRRIIEFACR